jgi:hypothetical protein
MTCSGLGVMRAKLIAGYSRTISGISTTALLSRLASSFALVCNRAKRLSPEEMIFTRPSFA